MPAIMRNPSGNSVSKMAARMTPDGVAHAAKDDHDHEGDGLHEAETVGG